MENQSDHDLLNQIDTKLTIMLDNFDKHTEDDKTVFKDHDRRIRRTENVIYMCSGIIIFIQLMVKFM